MEQWAQHIIDAPSGVYLPSARPRRESDDLTQVSLYSTSPSTLVERDDGTCNSAKYTRYSFLTTTNWRWRGITALLAGVCQQSLCWGMIMTYGSILTFYTQHLLPEISNTVLSLIGAIPPFFVLGMSLLWGRLLDAGHHRKINIFAGICLTAGLTGLAFTGEDGDYSDGQCWQILLASIPIGIGQSCYFLAAPHMAKSWYPSRKGLAMGITNSGAAIGGVVWPLVFTKMTADHSFRAGIGTLAGISAIIGIFIVYASTPAVSFERRPIGNPLKVRTWVPLHGFRSVTFVVHIAAMCCVYLGILTIPFFIEYWAQQNGIGITEDTRGGLGVTDRDGPLTVYLVVIMNACQLPGRLLGSTLCDKMKARKLHALSCVAAIIIIGPAWLYATTYAQGCVFAALFGLTLGVMVSLPINDVADILGPLRTHMLGQYAGVVYTIASPFILGGAIVSGALVDHEHNHGTGIGIWAAACFGACAVLITLSLILPDDTWKFDERSDDNQDIEKDSKPQRKSWHP